MTVLPIIQYPNQVLSDRTEDVTGYDQDTQALIRDMTETLIANEGAGLAAPQIGVSKALIIVQNPETKEIYVLCNPVIVEHSDETEFGYEGCLSLPGKVGKVRRFTSIKIMGFNGEGKVAIVNASGFLARAFQHEISHLNGRLIKDDTKYMFSLDVNGKIVR